MVEQREARGIHGQQQENPCWYREFGEIVQIIPHFLRRKEGWLQRPYDQIWRVHQWKVTESIIKLITYQYLRLDFPFLVEKNCSETVIEVNSFLIDGKQKIKDMP